MNLSSFLLKENRASQDIGLLLLRIVAGLVLLYGHGFQKLTVIFTGQEIRFGDPLGIGMTSSFYLVAFAEGICALLLIFGLFSRAAALILTFNFLVILWVHLGDEFKILELRFFYLASYTALALLGPGRISLDYLLFNPNKKRSAHRA